MQSRTPSSDLFGMLLQTMPECIYFKDLEGRFTRVSQSVADFLGVREPEQVVGKSDFDFYPAEDAQTYRRDEQEIMSTGRPLNNKVERCVRPNGEVRYHSVTKVPIHDAEGRVAGIAGISRDITGERKAAAALRESDERFRRVFESDLIGIHFWDAAGNVTEANDAYLRLTGYTHEDVAVRRVRWRDLTPPEYAPVDNLSLEIMRRQGSCPPFEKEYIRKDGTRIPVLLSAALLPASGHEGLAFALDLSALKQAESALGSQRNEMEVILDSVPAFVWYKDRENRIIRVNAAAAASAGLTKAEIEGRSVYEMYPAEAEMYHRDDLEVIKSGKPKLGIIEHLRLGNGELRWIKTDKVPYRDAHGDIIGVVVFAVDITELKLVEEALRREQHLMQILMDHMPDAIYFKDRESRFLRVNSAQARYLGLKTPDEARGRRDTEFFPAAAAQEYFNDEQAVIRSGTALVGKIEHNGRSGEALRWFSTTKVPIRDANGAIVGTAGISREITKIKQTEEALRREQQLMQILMDHMPDAIYFKDRESRFLRTNLAHARIMNLSDPADAIGKTDASFFRPADAAQFRADELRVIESGAALVNRLEYHGGAAGEMRWWSTTKVPLRGSDGQIIGIAGITRDITALKRAEEEIRQLNEQLEQRVADRTARLEAVNKRLREEIAERLEIEQRLRSSQEQLQSLASELSLAEERERRRIASDLHDQIGQTLALVQIKLQGLRDSNQGRDIQSAIGDCVDLLRQPILATRSLVFNLSPPVLYDLGIVAAAGWLVEQHQDQHGLKVALEDDEQPKPLDETVAVLAFRAVRELLTNVIKHAKATSARLSLRCEDDSLRISLEDDGIGFDAAASGMHGGRAAGYGLFSIRQQLDRIGGVLEIDSEIGRGTRMILSVPLQRNVDLTSNEGGSNGHQDTARG